MNTWSGSFSMLTNSDLLLYILKGVLFTIIISVIAVLIGIILGTILALIRNYCVSNKKTGIKKYIMKFIRFFAVAYIEIFRNTPLLLWIFISLVMFPLPKIFQKPMFGLSAVEFGILIKASFALTLFTSSVIAEIIRGGLNSVDKGQFEAGHSQGFGTIGIMLYIVLPQAFRNIVPTLLSQVITTIKDSSYLANVAIIELMSRVKTLLASSYLYNGTSTVNTSDVFVLFGFAALIYFIINFTISLIVRNIQKTKFS